MYLSIVGVVILFVRRSHEYATSRVVPKPVPLRIISVVRSYEHSFGAWGSVIMIGLMVLHSVAFEPSEIITITWPTGIGILPLLYYSVTG